MGGALVLNRLRSLQECSLAYWGSNSQVAHATSATPTGPFVKQDTTLPVWSHNPQVMMVSGDCLHAYPPARTPQVTLVPGDPPLFALWHIGGANGGHPANCTGHGGVDPARPPPSSPSPPAGAASSLHLSNSPSGPWEPVLSPLPSCNNPSQWRHKNGTWYIACNSAQV